MMTTATYGYIATAAVIALIYFTSKVLSLAWQTHKIRKALLRCYPTGKVHWLLGHMLEFPGLNEAGLMWNYDMTSRFPRGYLGLLGPFPRLNLHHPETIKQVTRTTAPKQTSEGGAYGLLQPWIGDGLLISKGSKWFRNRKLLTPGFHFDVLKPYVTVYNECADRLVERFASQSAATGDSIDVYHPVSLCSLDVILRCAFSYKKDVQNDHGSSHSYVHAVHEMGRLISDRALKPYLWPDFIYYCTKNGAKFHRNITLSHQVANDIIRKRKHELKNVDTIDKLSQKRYVDFLDILLLAKDEHGSGLSDQEILDETETFMFEGHDTTTSAISWLLYNLARHPELQQRARAEIDSIVDDDHNERDTQSDTIEWSDLSRMPYLTRCIKESLRLHTAVPYTGRQLEAAVEIDGHLLPAGTQIDLNLWNLHHNKEIWPDPMTYDPDRFLPERINQMDSHAFMPFSAGPRNCIGQNFAMNEIKTVVAKVLRCFELTVDTTKEIEMLPDMVLRSKSGIHLHLSSRK